MLSSLQKFAPIYNYFRRVIFNYIYGLPSTHTNLFIHTLLRLLVQVDHYPTNQLRKITGSPKPRRSIYITPASYPPPARVRSCCFAYLNIIYVLSRAEGRALVKKARRRRASFFSSGIYVYYIYKYNATACWIYPSVMYLSVQREQRGSLLVKIY